MQSAKVTLMLPLVWVVLLMASQINQAASCELLEAPENGVVTFCFGSNTGDTCFLECNDGYQSSGIGIRTCQSDGTWDGYFECTKIICSVLKAPHNGMISCALGDDGIPTVRETCSFTCNDDYQVLGSATLTCGSYGSWSASVPTCIRADCPILLHPVNGQVQCSPGDDGFVSFGDTCSYICNYGFALTDIGNSSRICQRDGSWSGSSPTCDTISCGALEAPNNGQIDCTGHLHNSACFFECNSGYITTGFPIRTCEGDGSWSDTEVVCTANCGGPPKVPDNGTVQCTGYQFNDECTFMCNDGYELAGSAVRTCQDNRIWSGTDTVCISQGESCKRLYDADPTTHGKSGYYRLGCSLLGDAGRYVYCDMEQRVECGSTGGWTRLASVDIAKGDECPTGWSKSSKDGTSFCRSPTDSAGCYSALFSSNGISYQKVCGMARGYQKGQPDALLHGDGLFITHGEPRQHIWTYAAGYSDHENAANHILSNCPCAAKPGFISSSFTGIKNNYYCEAGIADVVPDLNSYYFSDPLWDGSDCPTGNTCCDNPNLPWFYRELNITTMDAVEVRICTDEPFSNEAVLVDQLELYIQ